MAKESIRQRVWDDLADSGEARFPFPPHDRIPNVAGAETAADRAMGTPELAGADAVKANPDAPQLPLRRRLLRAGTTLYVAAPRLAEEAPFLELDPEAVTDLEAAPTVSHVEDHGRRVGPEAVPPLDAIVVGSVAVTPGGVRVGENNGSYTVTLRKKVAEQLGIRPGDEMEVRDEPGANEFRSRPTEEFGGVSYTI